MKQKTNKPRPYTEQEVRDQFLRCVWDRINFWETCPSKTSREKLEGLSHSIMALIDGCAINCPGFIMKPNPHPDDKEYNKVNDENWYPTNVDIAGVLHELFFKKRPL